MFTYGGKTRRELLAMCDEEECSNHDLAVTARVAVPELLERIAALKLRIYRMEVLGESEE